MTLFKYTGMQKSGKKVSGQLEAENISHAKQLIRSKDLYIVDLSPSKKREFFKFERDISPKPNEVSIFAIELAGLLKAGAPLRKALEIQSKGQGTQADMAKNVSITIDNGGKLSEGIKELGPSAQILAEFTSAGESGAGLDVLLQNGGEFIRSRQEALSKIKNALAYPIFILFLAIISISILIIYVAPALAPALEENGGQSNFILTMAKAGDWFQNHSAILLSGLAGAILISFFILRRPQSKLFINSLMWRMPLIGKILQDLDVGQSCEVLSALIESGRPIDIALEYASAVSGPTLSKSYSQMSLKIRDGALMSSAFEQETNLPIEVKRLALLGEQTSALGLSVKQAGSLCYDRAMQKIDRFSAVIGPFLVISMGIGIAILMLNVLGSISQIGDVPL